VVVAEAAGPRGNRACNGLAKPFAAFEFDAVPLTVIEADRFDSLLTIERPGEARGGFLAAGKQHESATLGVIADHRETP